MKDPRPTFSVVIPVLNEAGNVPRLFESLRAMAARLQSDVRPRFFLVDDGSTDGTADAARAHAAGLDFTVLRHDVNQGPGRAFATAFAHLADGLRPDDWIATMEGDNTSRAELLQQMLRRAQAEDFDVVLASPYLYGGGITNTSLYRVVLSHVANLFVKEALGLRGIVTMSSFFRLHRGRVILRLQQRYGPGIVERAGFESMIEMLLKLVCLEATISEIAMRLDTSRRAGKSKMKTMRTIRGYLTLWRDRPRWVAAAR